jgi:uncharacterized protein
MQFNKIVRGPNRAANEVENVHAILDAGFLCHVAFIHEGVPMQIPTAYGRAGDCIYLHGSTKNFMLNQIINGQTTCIAVTHLDGIVLARTLFDTSANYRSAVLFGKATLVTNEAERLKGLEIITENVLKGRWAEVPVGTPNELKATMVVKFTIESASAKIRNEGPKGDEGKNEVQVWSGHIPLQLKAQAPIFDTKFGPDVLEQSVSIKNYYEQNK